MVAVHCLMHSLARKVTVISCLNDPFFNWYHQNLLLMVLNISYLRVFAACFALCFGFLSCMLFFSHFFSDWCPPFKPLWHPLPGTSSPVLVKTSSRTSEYQMKMCIMARIISEKIYFLVIPFDFIGRRIHCFTTLNTDLLWCLFVFPCACVSLALFHLCCIICVYT